MRTTERLKIRLNTGKTNGKKTNKTRKQLGAQGCAIKRRKDEIKSRKIERLSSATSESDRTRQERTHARKRQVKRQKVRIAQPIKATEVTVRQAQTVQMH